MLSPNGNVVRYLDVVDRQVKINDSFSCKELQKWRYQLVFHPDMNIDFETATCVRLTNGKSCIKWFFEISPNCNEAQLNFEVGYYSSSFRKKEECKILVLSGSDNSLGLVCDLYLIKVISIKMKGMCMLASRLLLDFLIRPGFYWRNNRRQLEKTRSRVSNIEAYYDWSTISLVNILTAIAQERILNRVDTIFLPSFGSSGSHLMQHVLHKYYGMIALGEIYLPPKLRDLIKNELSMHEQNIFIEGFHLIHSHPASIFMNREIVNTAHYPDLNGYKNSTGNYKKGLILRNPIDIIISRTFKKSEYRVYLEKNNVSDLDYLKENIRKAKNFYDTAFEFNYDKYFFYEDMVASHENFSNSVVSFVGRGDVQIVKSELQKALEKGVTNKYSGPKVEVPEKLIEHAKYELLGVSNKFDLIKRGGDL